MTTASREDPAGRNGFLGPHIRIGRQACLWRCFLAGVAWIPRV
jgi:hypothetical protein